MLRPCWGLSIAEGPSGEIGDVPWEPWPAYSCFRLGAVSYTHLTVETEAAGFPALPEEVPEEVVQHVAEMCIRDRPTSVPALSVKRLFGRRATPTRLALRIIYSRMGALDGA